MTQSILPSNFTPIYICPKELKMYVHAKTCTWMFIVALFITAKNWKQPKCPCSQRYDFSSSHVWMWELDHKENWAPKNWCFWTVVLEKTLENPLNSKETKPVHPKGNQSWIFIGRTDAEAEAPILCPPDVKSWLIWEDPNDGKDWRWEEKGTTEDEMVVWHHWLNGCEFE